MGVIESRLIQFTPSIECAEEGKVCIVVFTKAYVALHGELERRGGGV